MVFLAASPSMAQKPRLPGIKGQDNRKLVQTVAYPWSAIGRVNRSTGGYCTGTVVAPDRVLTAAHCMWNKRTRRWLAARTLHFVAGYQRGAYVSHARIAGYDTPRGYMPTQASGRKPVNDWVILRLKTKIGDVTGVLRPAPLSAAAIAAFRRGTMVLQAGYSQDKAHILSLHEGCRITGTAAGDRLLLHDCDATKGDSGSPLLVRNGDGYRLIAMHVATVRRRGRVHGLAVAGVVFHRWLMGRGGKGNGVIRP